LGRIMKIHLYSFAGTWGYKVAWQGVTHMGWGRTREAARAQVKKEVQAVYRKATRRAEVVN